MTDFDFNKTYVLEDERVLLRPLAENDLVHLLPYSLHEPELWKYSLVEVAGEANLEEYIRTALLNKAAEREYPFIVYDKLTQQYAGSTRFYDINLPFQTLQLGYTWYGKAFHGTGLNRHCKALLLRFAFDTMGMVRVEFRADLENKRSIAAMEKIGCVREGVLRQNTPKPDGSRRDSIVLSILKTAWDDTISKVLKP